MQKNKIVVVGSTNVDMIVKGDKIPGPGETVIGGTFHQAAGGKGANQATAAARAGGEVCFITCVGKDSFGQESLQRFKSEGMQTEFVKMDAHSATGIALILVDEKGENSISVASGANEQLLPEDLKTAQPAIEAADIMLLQLESPLETVEAAAKMAKAAGVTTILNPAPARPLHADLLANVSILTPNESEASLLSGIEIKEESDIPRAAQKLQEMGVETVLITLGKQGVFMKTADKAHLIPSFPVKAVDTTAAGDTFNGALAVALAEGQELAQAIRFANAAGAIAVTRMGAQDSAPGRGEIEAFLAAGS